MVNGDTETRGQPGTRPEDERKPPGADEEKERAEYERHKKGIARTAEVISLGDDKAATKAARLLFGGMEEDPEKFNPYTFKDIKQALTERIALEENPAQKEEFRRLKREAVAREAIHGSYADWCYVREDVGKMGTLLLQGWKTTPTAQDYRDLFNAPPTPASIKEDRVDPSKEGGWDPEDIVWEIEIIKDEDEDGNFVEKARRRKGRVREGLKGLRGIVEKNERPLGEQIDEGLRLYAALSIARGAAEIPPDEGELSPGGRETEKERLVRAEKRQARVGKNEYRRRCLREKIFPSRDRKEKEPERDERIEREVVKARRCVAESVAKAPDEFLAKLLSKTTSSGEWRPGTGEEVQAAREQTRQYLGYLLLESGEASEELLEEARRTKIDGEEIKSDFDKVLEAFPMIACEPVGGRIDLVREWVRTQVSDEAEQIAWGLFHTWEVATELNFDVETTTDDLVKMTHFNRFRQKGAAVGDAAGPPAGVGDENTKYFLDMTTDFLHLNNEKLDGSGKDLWTLWWEEGRALGELPWNELREETYNGFLYHRYRAHQVYERAMKTKDWKPEDFLNGLTWADENKPDRMAHIIKFIDEEDKYTMRANTLIAALLLFVSYGNGTSFDRNPPMEGDGVMSWNKIKDLIEQTVTEKSRYLRPGDWDLVKKGMKKRTCIPIS